MSTWSVLALSILEHFSGTETTHFYSNSSNNTVEPTLINDFKIQFFTLKNCCNIRRRLFHRILTSIISWISLCSLMGFHNNLKFSHIISVYWFTISTICIYCHRWRFEIFRRHPRQLSPRHGLNKVAASKEAIFPLFA